VRYINITELKATFDRIKGIGAFSKWEDEAKKHLQKVEEKNKKDRSIYWSNKNTWSELYSALSELSGDKCWYTESKENSSEWQVDHFRPKGKSIDEKGKEILKDGYWWLSYDWKNFRLSGSLSNLLRKDRFDDKDEVFGKGNFFPLKDLATVAKPKDRLCKLERPVLLDPTNARDVKLIAFDRNGESYESYNEDDSSFYHLRAFVSIKCYGLNHKPLIRGRAKVWETCESIVDEAQNELSVHIGDEDMIEDIIDDCFNKLAKLANKKQPHSMVVFNYLSEKSKEDNFEWLEDAITAIV
jgi:hypothetical protein